VSSRRLTDMDRFAQGLWLTFTLLSMIVLGFADNLRGPLFFDILQDFHLSDLQGAWFYSASSLFGFFASIGSAYFLKRIHLLQLLIISLFVMALALVGISYFHNFYLFLLAAGCLGTSMGFMSVAQNSSISFLTTEKTQSRAFSALHSMYGISSFLAPLAVGWGISSGWLWRDFFRFTAIMVLIVFLISLISPFPDWAKEHRSTPQPEKNTIRGLGIVSIYMSVGLSFYVIAEILIGSRLSLYTIRELGLCTSEASRYVTGFYLGMLVGRLIGIFVKWPGTFRKQLYVSLFLSFLTMVLGLYHNAWWFAFTGLTMSTFYPTLIYYLSEIYQKRIGVMMSLAIAAQSFSIVVMHQIVGLISDYSGIKVAFHLGLVFIFLSAFFLWRGEVERHKY
jgi:MFS transporter, FHS family, glucose/mannose:H+ symporter